MKTYESSTTTLRALLAHPSLQRGAVERTFDALADTNADAQELNEVVRTGKDVALGVDVSPDDEDEIKAKLAALEAKAKTDARIVTTRSLTHFILASGLSNTLYDWTVVTLNESSILRSVSTPYESRYL